MSKFESFLFHFILYSVLVYNRAINENIDYKSLLEWLIDNMSCSELAPILMHWHDPEYLYVQELIGSDKEKEMQKQFESMIESKYPGYILQAVEFGIKQRHGEDSNYLKEFKKKTYLTQD